jgi:hypothetical protein
LEIFLKKSLTIVLVSGNHNAMIPGGKDSVGLGIGKSYITTFNDGTEPA